MLKTFQVDGDAVNKRGNTVGIHYTLTSASPDAAKSTAQLLAQQGGYLHVRINFVREVAA
ncbi:hypothetical protein [Raoultella sp. T31]|uniref:hypothetical protein n=1 Tax=Raoultella sp. T31 TaxID=2054594 RepID=UPI000C28C381|nr:hypothetical protein CWM52_11915 [Raoultella sp. T31]